MPQSDRFCQN